MKSFGNVNMRILQYECLSYPDYKYVVFRTPYYQVLVLKILPGTSLERFRRSTNPCMNCRLTTVSDHAPHSATRTATRTQVRELSSYY
jgi:hypothetical protein